MMLWGPPRLRLTAWDQQWTLQQFFSQTLPEHLVWFFCSDLCRSWSHSRTWFLIVSETFQLLFCFCRSIVADQIINLNIRTCKQVPGDRNRHFLYRVLTVPLTRAWSCFSSWFFISWLHVLSFCVALCFTVIFIFFILQC